MCVWLSEDVVSFKIEVGFTRNLYKRHSDFTKKSWLTATFTRVNIAIAMVALLVVCLLCPVWAILASLWENLA